MQERDEDTIDLRIVKDIIVERKKTLISILGVCILLAVTLAFILPKEYQSTTLIRARNQSQGGFSMQAAAAIALIGGSASSPIQAYIEMLKSRSVLEPVMEQLDLPEEAKEKMTAAAFAKGYLDIKNAKGTDLIEVTAKGKTPEEAQQISREVVESFQKTLTRLNQTDKSMLMIFLTERLSIAKDEMEDAELALEVFRQDAKIYVPEEQSKSVLDMLAKFDEQITALEVQNQTNYVRLEAVNQQLEQQNIALRKYNLADNETIRKMRERIVEKQTTLVELTQRYTEKHPDVLLARQEIEELENQLKKEVEYSIEAGTNTLNPIHASLLQTKTNIESSLLTDKALEEVLRQKQAEVESKISELSTNSLTYIGLERQVKISQEVYSLLVKNYEQTRIQESMESMDFQIIDEADLAKLPSAPRKTLITAIGGVIGIMLSFAYVLVLYSRMPAKKY